jgi:Fusaric acid resistance protein family
MPDQRLLSDRVKTAIKTALATVLAYGVALSMDWEHAYWAAFAVAFCTLSTVGESLNKGLLRLSGTLLGSLASSWLLQSACALSRFGLNAPGAHRCDVIPELGSHDDRRCPTAGNERREFPY